MYKRHATKSAKKKASIHVNNRWWRAAQPTTDTARHASLAPHTHTQLESENTTRITRHGQRGARGRVRHNLRWITAVAARSQSCGDGGRSGCARLTSGGARQSLLTSRRTCQNGGAGLDRGLASSRGGAGLRNGYAPPGSIECKKSCILQMRSSSLDPCHSCIWASMRARRLRARLRRRNARPSRTSGGPWRRG